MTERSVGLALITLAFTAGLAEAQLIRGSVVDGSSGEPVGGAEVVLLTRRAAERVAVATDSGGVFVLRVPRADSYRLRVTHPSFIPFETDSVEVHSGEAVLLEVRLGREAVPLEPIVVTARRNAGMTGFDERRASGFGRYITREEIDRRSAFRTSDLLSNVRGITLRSAGAGGMLVLMRGGGAGVCEPTLWLDGVRVRQVPGSTIDDFLHPGDIEGIEIYTSRAAAPVEYAVGACGVVVAWTRRGTGDDGGPWQWKKLLAGAGTALVVIWLIGR